MYVTESWKGVLDAGPGFGRYLNQCSFAQNEWIKASNLAIKVC